MKSCMTLFLENLRHNFTERPMVSEYRTLNCGDLQIPKVRLEYAKRSFYHPFTFLLFLCQKLE